MAISIEDIVEAADLLFKRGEKPTLFLVRKTVGGGSYSMINEGLGVWRQRRRTAKLVQLEAVRQGMITDTQALPGRQRDHAENGAQHPLDEERQAWTQIREESEAEAKEATRIADDLADELEATRVECAEAKDRLKGLEVRVKEASQAISGLEKDLLIQQAVAATAEFDCDKLQAAATECSGLLKTLKHRLHELESDLARESERRVNAERYRALFMSEQCCLF